MVRFVVVFLACVAVRLSAQQFVVPDGEVAQPPTAARMSALLEAAARDGWSPQIAPLRTAAFRAYQQGRLQSANAWFHVYSWASLFGETEAEFAPRWVAAVNEAKVGHANMPTSVPMRNVPLAAALAVETQRWLITNPAFSEEFFATLTPVDYLPRVFEILNALYRANPERFRTYSDLALAIAVVYDVPPPPIWPHAQVTAQALPRRLPPALEAFNWWVRQDQSGMTFQRLNRLNADELKFVVDAAAPFAELEWAQRSVPVTVADLPRAYSSIRYRMDRITANQPVWTARTYRLADILTNGGICADQAYFATEVGKARGVPTLLFTGAGNDGRHAWFGYLDGNQQWQLDAGRYAEQRFVTGIARDPQTWRELSDHELQFLTERFHSALSYRQSRVHEEFAADMLADGDSAGAAVAARLAVKFEPRNQVAWETLITATGRLSPDPRATEVILREAALAFQRYPDLEAQYTVRVTESLRARGQISEAEAEIRRIARKNQQARVDISVQQAHDVVLRAMKTQPLPQQIRAYDQVVESLGPGAGIGFFDDVVTLFVEHLVQLQHRPEARRALEHARAVLAVQPNSQLEAEFKRLQATIDAGAGRPGG